METLYIRQIINTLKERIEETPVLLLQGPRSVGKSTLLSNVAKEYNADVLDFDNPKNVELFNAIGDEIFPQKKYIFIDEYQKAKEILDYIKVRLNRSSSSGQFIISGSISFDALPKGTQSLTGRIDKLNIYPLSQAEINGNNSNFFQELLFDSKNIIQNQNKKRHISRNQYLKKLSIGGFPLALNKANERALSRWFTNYIDYTINHDIKQISAVRQNFEMKELIKRLSKNTAGVLNIARISDDIGINQKLVNQYVSLLERVFMINKLPVSTTVKHERLLKHPKLHFIDSGIATHLMGINSSTILNHEIQKANNIGALFETFVVNEITRLCSSLDNIQEIGYFRTRQGLEIDLILELTNGKIIAIEIKSSSNIRSSDFKHLKEYKKLAGQKLHCAIMFYTGNVAGKTSDDILLLPVDSLWN